MKLLIATTKLANISVVLLRWTHINKYSAWDKWIQFTKRYSNSKLMNNFQIVRFISRRNKLQSNLLRDLNGGAGNRSGNDNIACRRRPLPPPGPARKIDLQHDSHRTTSTTTSTATSAANSSYCNPVSKNNNNNNHKNTTSYNSNNNNSSYCDNSSRSSAYCSSNNSNQLSLTAFHPHHHHKVSTTSNTVPTIL